MVALKSCYGCLALQDFKSSRIRAFIVVSLLFLELMSSNYIRFPSATLKSDIREENSSLWQPHHAGAMMGTVVSRRVLPCTTVHELRRPVPVLVTLRFATAYSPSSPDRILKESPAPYPTTNSVITVWLLIQGSS
jgi:hypothetical protein